MQNKNQNTIFTDSRLNKITAIWALSEALLGGVLHAFKIPFRGIILSGSAVILITLLASFSDKKGQILKSTMIVILIKGLISPHTPVAAYFSVFLQGFLGEVFFISRKVKYISVLFFSLTILFLTGMQKPLSMTIIYGETFWKAINDFTNFVIKDFFNSNSSGEINLSFYLVSVYLGIHLLAGLIIGNLAYKICSRVNSKIKLDQEILNNVRIKAEQFAEISIKKKKSRKGIYGFWFALILSVTIIGLSFLFPESKNLQAAPLIAMLIRATLIILLWVLVINPLLKLFINKYLKNKRGKYATEINSVIGQFPVLKKEIMSIWDMYSGKNIFLRVTLFSETFIIYTLSDKAGEES